MSTFYGPQRTNTGAHTQRERAKWRRNCRRSSGQRRKEKPPKQQIITQTCTTKRNIISMGTFCMYSHSDVCERATNKHTNTFKRTHTYTQRAHGYLCLFFIYEDPINGIKSRTILFSHISPLILIYVSVLCVHYILVRYYWNVEHKTEEQDRAARWAE